MNSLMESWPRKHRITVDEYCRMAEVGLLAPDARVELIEGEIIDMAPIADRYRHALAGPADILLLVEVSDTTLEYDREVKIPLYAQHGIPEAWIVDLQNGELRWYRNPRAGGYVDQGTTKSPGVVPIAALPGTAIDLSGLFSA